MGRDCVIIYPSIGKDSKCMAQKLSDLIEGTTEVAEVYNPETKVKEYCVIVKKFNFGMKAKYDPIEDKEA